MYLKRGQILTSSALLREAKPRFIKFWTICPKFYKGFTLIELSVVIFLIGLIFFTAMPRLGNFLFHSDLKSVARSLKATVNVLRSKSIVTHKNTVLHFDIDNGVYWGAYADMGKESKISLDTSDASQLVTPRKLPRGIKFLDATNINSPKKRSGLLSSSFNPKGIIEETVLHLADRDERVLTIIINAYTGRFLIYNEYVDVEYGND
jgi:prepilin-type N-terminal cleavage/methylation domain-containing protein